MLNDYIYDYIYAFNMSIKLFMIEDVVVFNNVQNVIIYMPALLL